MDIYRYSVAMTGVAQTDSDLQYICLSFMQYLKLQLDILSAALTHPNLDNQPKSNLIANLVGIFSSSCLHLAPLDQSLCVTVAFLYLKQIITKDD